MSALLFYFWAIARVLQNPLYLALYILVLLAGVVLDSTGVTHGYSSLGDKQLLNFILMEQPYEPSCDNVFIPGPLYRARLKGEPQVV